MVASTVIGADIKSARKEDGMFKKLCNRMRFGLFRRHKQANTLEGQNTESGGVNYQLTSVFPSTAAMETALKVCPYTDNKDSKN